MKFIFDENLPPVLADALGKLATGHPYEIYHVSRKFQASIKDEVWIKAVGQEGGWIAITNDHHMKTRPHEIAAWQSYGLIGFVLPKSFNQLKFWSKAAFLTRWWECIVGMSETAEPGDMFFIPDSWTPKLFKPHRRRATKSGKSASIS